MRKLALFILCISTAIVNGQELLKHVPATAECVISLNGKALTSKIGKRKIEKSDAFLSITENFLFKGRGEGQLSDVGVDLKNDFVFFFDADTSMEYMGYLYGIDKKRTFEKYIQENTGAGEKKALDDFSILFYEDNYHFLAWNSDYALFVSVDYLQEGLRPTDDYSTIEWFPEEVPVEETEDAIESEGEVTEMTPEEMEAVEARRKAEAEAEEKRIAERLEKLRTAYIDQVSPIFKGDRKDHILTNSSYTSGRNENSDAYLWITQPRNVHDFRYYGYYNYYNGRRHYRRFMHGFSQIFGSKITINAFMGEDIRFVSDLSFDAEIAQYFKEIYSGQISKKLLNYINTDEALAVSSFSVVAEKIWQHYPRIYARFYEKMYNRDDEDFSEEMDVLLDFVAIFMDEKALGEIATGDAIFVLKELAEVDVKYTTYEYNEDYSERKEVEKTRTEIFPEFLGMFTTKNKAFLEKLLKLAVKNEVMYRDNQYYYTDGENRDLPFEIGFTIQNGIAFIGSDLAEIKSISDGSFENKAGKSLEKAITSNQGFMHMNLASLLKSIPNEGLGDKDRKAMDYARENTRSIQSLTNLTGESIQSVMTAKIPKSAKNGAEYLWDFMEEMHRIDQEGKTNED